MTTKNMVDEVHSNVNGGRIPEIDYVENALTGDRIQTVGFQGVTRIELYNESGSMSWIPWLAVYKEDFLFARIDTAGMKIVYKEPE